MHIDGTNYKAVCSIIYNRNLTKKLNSIENNLKNHLIYWCVVKRGRKGFPDIVRDLLGLVSRNEVGDSGVLSPVSSAV